MPEQTTLDKLRAKYALDRDRGIRRFDEKDEQTPMTFHLPGRITVRYTMFDDRVSRCETHHRTGGVMPEVYVTFAVR